MSERHCPICETGVLHSKEELIPVEGTSSYVNSHYSVCDSCGSEQADTEEVRVNKSNMEKFRFKYKVL